MSTCNYHYALLLYKQIMTYYKYAKIALKHEPPTW